MQDREEIIKKYEEYYKQLLTTRKLDIMAEEIAEEGVNKEFESIMKQKNYSSKEKNICHGQESNINNEKRKAGDKLGRKAEWLIEGGDEMTKSLEILYNRIEQEK